MVLGRGACAVVWVVALLLRGAVQLLLQFE